MSKLKLFIDARRQSERTIFVHKTNVMGTTQIGRLVSANNDMAQVYTDNGQVEAKVDVNIGTGMHNINVWCLSDADRDEYNKMANFLSTKSAYGKTLAEVEHPIDRLMLASQMFGIGFQVQITYATGTTAVVAVDSVDKGRVTLADGQGPFHVMDNQGVGVSLMLGDPLIEMVVDHLRAYLVERAQVDFKDMIAVLPTTGIAIARNLRTMFPSDNAYALVLNPESPSDYVGYTACLTADTFNLETDLSYDVWEVIE
jgi:hypothetical protein